MLKAFYKVDGQVQNPVQPSADGLSLVPYTDGPLYYVDELDKLASNVGMARLFAGVHWRSDHEYAVRLGELVALRTLQDRARTYTEPFNGFVVRTFGATPSSSARTGPDLPNHVSGVVGFALINAGTGQVIPGYESFNNGTTLNLNTLPTRNLSIRASMYQSTVGSVRFDYDSASSVDNTATYDFAFTPTVGTHVLTATPFSQINSGGLAAIR